MTTRTHINPGVGRKPEYGTALSLLLFLVAKYRNHRMHPSGKCLICGIKAGCNHTAGTLKENSMLMLGAGDGLGDDLGTEIIHPQRILEVAANGVVKMPCSASQQTSLPIAKNQRFESCSFCGGSIVDIMLNHHLLRHVEGDHSLLNIANFQRKTPERSPSTQVRVATTSVQPELVPKDRSPTELRNFFKVDEIPHTKIKPTERFRFRALHDVSWCSATSTSGRYSDFNLIVWMKESLRAHNTGYSGGSHTHTYISRDRLNIHLVYDRVEHYYTISNRNFRRNEFSNFELDETLVPDRICEQHELISEIRKILLYYNIPPRAVLKRLLKVLREDMNIDIDEETKSVYYCYSFNHLPLFEELKEMSKSSNNNYYNQNAQATYFGHPYSQHMD